MRDLMQVTSSPHMHSGQSIRKIMWIVFLTLIPSGVWGVYCFGPKALYLIAASIITCILTEAIILKLRKGYMYRRCLFHSYSKTGLRWLGEEYIQSRIGRQGISYGILANIYGGL